MMNKLVTAAVVGGAALAVGVLPAVSAAAATLPTPIPVPTSPSAPANPVTHDPNAPGHRPPGHHRAPGGHHKGTGGKAHGGKAGKHKPTKHKPGAHKPGAHKPVGHKPVGKPVVGPIVGKPVVGKPVVGKPIVGKPIGHKPRKPVVHKPVVHKPVVGQPTTGAPKPVSTPRIIGGKDAGDAPWAAQVVWDDAGFECSGTTVAAQWVLTARHCVSPYGMTVLIGSNQLGDGTKAAVDDKIVDPVGDLVLLHLAEPVQTTYVQLADADPKPGSINDIYGWGMTDPTSGPSEQLKTARVKVTSVDCKDAQGGRAICSTGITGTAYRGDSGGPEMAAGVEVGVCSTGNDEAKTQQYASVAANRTWIRQIANV
ncbi:MAG TPA: trypsin-like serine protease [Pseudonocardiaceae bacterium]|nr:trypsin-like serine protease [Pseudonocardiaceae bacterium]